MYTWNLLEITSKFYVVALKATVDLHNIKHICVCSITILIVTCLASVFNRISSTRRKLKNTCAQSPSCQFKFHRITSIKSCLFSNVCYRTFTLRILKQEGMRAMPPHNFLHLPFLITDCRIWWEQQYKIYAEPSESSSLWYILSGCFFVWTCCVHCALLSCQTPQNRTMYSQLPIQSGCFFITFCGGIW